jgi:hypothetical protein
MNVWFVRSNVDTSHNQPSTPNYVPGEPPDYPVTKFDYRGKCLAEGFARIGWPNTGDLRNMGEGRLAVNGYTFESLDEFSKSCLTEFRLIRTGDLILIPAGPRHHYHIGVVVLRERYTREISCIRPGLEAYYYYHNIEGGQWYECAHRVDVLWDREPDGSFGVHNIEGVPYRVRFSGLIEAEHRAIQVARRVGLPVVYGER